MEREKIDPARLAFDIDGVVADTMHLFLDIAREEFGISEFGYEDITSYELEDCLGLDGETIKKIVIRLLDTDSTAALVPISGAVDVLTRIGERHTPLFFVTARPELEAIEAWMQKTLPLTPENIDVVATGAFEAKTDVLLSRGITWFVEDRLETCFMLEEAGINPILFRQPWNRKAHPFPEVGSWKELSDMIRF